ncbi:hypothetical protein QC762_203332 [Podospora pseudocomata]|uniref:Uncharacterized protein n=1 Tax=Podospora pseudocomata TaxID=2093779 RepID=A0ABR0GQL7_9PEZI|nr:hypothetical protein QC762_203332 [Podospora pseudocomata]
MSLHDHFGSEREADLVKKLGREVRPEQTEMSAALGDKKAKQLGLSSRSLSPSESEIQPSGPQTITQAHEEETLDEEALDKWDTLQEEADAIFEMLYSLKTVDDVQPYTLDAALDQITRFHTSIVKAVQPASSYREKHRTAVLLIQVLSWIVTSNKLIGQDLREYVLGQSAEEEYRQWVDPMSDVLSCCTWAERRRIFKSRRWQWEFDLFVGLVMNCELFGEIFGLLEVAEHREEMFSDPAPAQQSDTEDGTIEDGMIYDAIAVFEDGEDEEEIVPLAGSLARSRSQVQMDVAQPREEVAAQAGREAAVQPAAGEAEPRNCQGEPRLAGKATGKRSHEGVDAGQGPRKRQARSSGRVSVHLHFHGTVQNVYLGSDSRS